ncbi:MAG: helix-turn-helix domain-containing protein [Chloracidobacterium sp.]|nr:helix-turn-helix domain-containing protein [Chloracidobacterium sp.]
MSYRQLTQEQRYQIWAALGTGMKKSDIARELKVDKSTISARSGETAHIEVIGHRRR